MMTGSCALKLPLSARAAGARLASATPTSQPSVPSLPGAAASGAAPLSGSSPPPALSGPIPPMPARSVGEPSLLDPALGAPAPDTAAPAPLGALPSPAPPAPAQAPKVQGVDADGSSPLVHAARA